MAYKGKAGIAFVGALLTLGLALMGWAVYGAMLLRGDAVIEGRDNIESMAKVMLYAAGPLGAILVFSAVVRVIWNRRSKI